MSRLNPNADAASRFLQCLDADDQFTFMALPEGPHRGRPRHPQTLHGVLAKSMDQLADLNECGHGCWRQPKTEPLLRVVPTQN